MIRLLLIAALMFGTAAIAVQPDEVLEDPALESRARTLSKEIRCLVCRNESIDESNAELARDLRILVRERLVAGDSDPQVLAYLVDRYGEYVLLRPPLNWGNAVLWLAPFGLLLGGAGVAVVFIRNRAAAPVVQGAEALSAEEIARLEALLDRPNHEKTSGPASLT